MTEPVSGIGGASRISGGGASGGGMFGRERKKRKSSGTGNDQVDISENARELSSGKKKSGLLALLRELFS